MSPSLSFVFVEGRLEEPVALKLVAEAGFEPPSRIVVADGSPSFWKRAPRFNKAAEHTGRVFALTDLDAHPCPSGLIASKLQQPLHPHFILRIPVRELESWLLADARGWKEFLGVSEAIVPREPDTLADAKREVINVARRCRRTILREDIVPREGVPRVVGPGYTTRMGEFVRSYWSPRRARQRSPSLERALIALEQTSRE